MTQQDTFDTLKHGYIPLTELLDHAKSEKFKLDQFKHDDAFESYSYGKAFKLLWDGDFYYIDCFINPPDPDFEDRPYPTVTFTSGVSIINEKERYFPPLMDHSMEFEIHTRQEFIDALNQWQQFVHTFYGIMLAHRIEIIEDVAKIVKSEKAINSMKKSKKSDYMKWMNQLPLMIAEDIQKIINFEEIKEEEQPDLEPIYLTEGIWLNQLTGEMYTLD